MISRPPSAEDFTVTPSENPGNIFVIKETDFPPQVLAATARAYSHPAGILVLEQSIINHETSLHLTPGETYRVYIRYGPDRFPQSPFHHYGLFTTSQP